MSVSAGISLRIYGAAVTSHGAAPCHGTAGHDGIPRALGIMPLRHRYKPVGVTIRKKPVLRSGFFYLSLYQQRNIS